MKELISQAIINDPAARVGNYKQMVQSFYDIVTDSYRQVWGDSFHFAIFSGSERFQEAIVATERMIADEGGFRPGMKILDVGCGVGGPALNIAEYSGAHVTGVNISNRQIAIARELAATRGLSELTEFVVADGMNMPFPDESFDRIYIFEAGCYMPDKAAFYKECARVMRPGGIFLGFDWMSKEELTAEEEAKYIEPICRYHALPGLITLGELGSYLINAGLEVEALDDIAERGNILRNWELLDNKILKTDSGLPNWLIPPVSLIQNYGAYKVLEGARSGALIVGHWRARKPSVTQEKLSI